MRTAHATLATYLTFQLTVTDNTGVTGSDQVVVTVVPTGKPDLSLSAIGSPLTAKAGTSFTVSTTVANNGAADAEGNFDVGVYLIPQPVLFSSTFDTGTLEGWSALKTGAISVVTDATDGKMLKKTTRADPNGGQALLSSSVGDFELTVYTKRLPSTGSARTNCYSLTGSTGNGYGLCLNYADGKLYLNRRATWAITNLGTAVAVTGGAVVNQWYTLQLVKQGTSLTAKAYLGRVVPSTATAIATVPTPTAPTPVLLRSTLMVVMITTPITSRSCNWSVPSRLTAAKSSLASARYIVWFGEPPAPEM